VRWREKEPSIERDSERHSLHYITKVSLKKEREREGGREKQTDRYA